MVLSFLSFSLLHSICGSCGFSLAVSYPNDLALHTQMVTLARNVLSTGRFPLDQWYPYLSLGSPFFVQYQSFSAIITGALSKLTGVHPAFVGTLYLLLALWPICIYLSARLLGWERWIAGAAAAMAPLLFSVTGHGFEAESYGWLGNGLWSQLWAMWTLPLAWGFSWRYISKRQYLFGAVATLGLTIAFHFLLAYLAGLTLIAWVLLRPREIVKRVGRAWLAGVGALLATLWVTLPLLLDSKWIAVNQFQVGTVIDNSYGARKVLGWLFTGQIYDYGHFPVISIFVAIGVLACLVRPNRRESASSARRVDLEFVALLWTANIGIRTRLVAGQRQFAVPALHLRRATRGTVHRGSRGGESRSVSWRCCSASAEQVSEDHGQRLVTSSSSPSRHRGLGIRTGSRMAGTSVVRIKQFLLDATTANCRSNARRATKRPSLHNQKSGRRKGVRGTPKQLGLQLQSGFGARLQLRHPSGRHRFGRVDVTDLIVDDGS